LGAVGPHPTQLLNTTSCVEEFARRQRPDFRLYLAGYMTMGSVIYFLIGGASLYPRVLLPGVAALALLCYRAWHCAAPVCPNCRQNIKVCAPVYCHVCGEQLAQRRCGQCGVDNSTTGLLFSSLGTGNFRWIRYCPGCGVRLDRRIRRWRAGLL
jgi:hypothetical protein